MKIVIAPDSFKGTLTASEVCNSIEKGIKNFIPNAKTVKLPLSDGGEGFVETMVSSTGGYIEKVWVKDPIGRKLEASFGILGDKKTAAIEMAAASGLTLLDDMERNPLKTSTYGTGQLIKAAMDKNIKKIIMGIGGSATVDGGVGMAMALGIRFLDKYCEPIGLGGGELEKIHTIDTGNIDPRVKNVQIEVACDVSNPLTGNSGAAIVFGPQKGASPLMAKKLDHYLTVFALKVKEQLNKDIEFMPGSGAAGGLGAGLLAFTNSILKSGIELVLQYSNFDIHVKEADLVITGEGKVDDQTLSGKVPMGVAKLAALAGCPVVIIAGKIEGNIQKFHPYNIHALFSIIPDIIPENELYARTPLLLENCAEQIIRAIYLGKMLKNH
ncbi:MAG: glycerate kinase [Chitinispirillia bacterium]|jgi:glycerate kinase